MNVIEINASWGCAPTIDLGQRGENLATEVRFDFSGWAEEFGAPGAVELYVRRAGETTPYPVALTIEDTVAVWPVSAIDTHIIGLGEAELVYLIDGAVVKTAVYGTAVEPDIGQPDGTPPDPYETWMEALGEMAAGTLINAQRAETAQEGAETAQTAAEAAQSAAETAQEASEAAQTGAEAAQTAAEAAQTAAEAAQTGAETAQTRAESAATNAANSASQSLDSATAAAASAATAQSAASTATQKATEAASSASSAATSASTATQKATAAANSATSAQNWALDAAQDATTAASASDDAQTYASNASASATAAANSATAAAASASAAAASETAAGNSATAASASETAAEAAQAAAETVLESIPQDYSALSDEVDDLKSAIDTKSPYIVNSVTGSDVQFSDGADSLPFVSADIVIEPIQTGSGDPSPTNIRNFVGVTDCSLTHSGDETETPETISFDWQSSAGVVYGCRVNVLTGVLTVEHFFLEFDGTETWDKNGQSDSRGYYYTNIAQNAIAAYCICSHCPWYGVSGNNTGIGANIAIVSGNMSFLIRLPAETVARRDVTAFKTWLASQKSAGTPLQAVGQFVEPLTYQLTAHDLQTFYGGNRLICDVGKISASYKADTKLAIEAAANVLEQQIEGSVAIGDQWEGKTWYCYGTSISNINNEGKYPTYLAQMSGMSLVCKGISGGGIGNLGAYSHGQVYNAICNITDGKLDADLITLEQGANDVSEDVDLGTIYDVGQTTLAGCLNDCIRYLQENTTAQIAIIASPYSKTAPTLTNKVFEWREMMRKICFLNGVEFIDASTNLGSSKLNSTYGSLYVRDNIHHTELGGYIFAQHLWYRLRNIPNFYTALPVT